MKKIFYTCLILFICNFKSFSQDLEIDSVQKASIKTKKHPILEDRIISNVGLYVPSKSIKIGANGTNPNEEIDFGKDFDFNQNESTLALNFIWRFSKSKKWNVGVEYFQVKSGHKLMIEKDIEWQDVIYKAGASIEAGFGMSMYRVFFGRTISSGLKHELGVGLGVHAMDVSSFIKGEAFIDDATTSFENRSVSAVAPFPNTGMWYLYAPSPKWGLIARVDWLAVTVGEYSGSLWNLAPGIKYQILKNIGVGVNYRYFKTTLKVDKQNWDGKLSVLFQGPLFTISGNF